MSDLPIPSPRGDDLPERRLTPEQFEAVIRRAAELQARGLESSPAETMSEGEVLRIAREIGISPVHVRRALAEVGTPAEPPALAERIFGPEWVQASRAVPGDPDSVRAAIDEYFSRRERLAPIRRFSDHTLYEKARGFDLAAIMVVAQDALNSQNQPPVGAGFKLRNARRVQVHARSLEDGYSYLTLAADLGNYRLTSGSVGTIGGAGAAASLGAVLAVAIDPLAGLLAAPLLPGAIWGARTMHLHTAARARLHLEAILDRVERGEPLVRARRRP